MEFYLNGITYSHVLIRNRRNWMQQSFSSAFSNGWNNFDEQSNLLNERRWSVKNIFLIIERTSVLVK